MLDPVADSLERCENYRAELILCDAEFEPAFDAIDQLILFFLVLITSMVNILFGTLVGNDPMQCPEVEPKPSPQVENSPKMTR